ncbi:DUF294 nucleotidyltransferase-like domain-containing protein [Anaerobacillus sp. 1_MG-2023]|uniref:DUF294 nucleotidyltransferase-like domain-containing protein n=1 Tax=Anaerobacillus sp. 1_MG-2023 TaxID=3062655 RepID=UPI0026E28B6E|nr:DUF294 nucleotidyltransferase-like domain-containing protein [Anaerobacillus sp. 1_MG-2023]MDO6657825.1 DUF294 nucleotidyltransferase-like domain-containing protein [Anaerobacillus sp. 1_MG-2023]
MDDGVENYEDLNKMREQQIKNVATDHFALNHFHDQLMSQIVHLAVEKVKKEWGPPPSPFSFFLMGSGGRFEQALWSDQDHGIVYEVTSEEASNYFLKLGKEISVGLNTVGYEFCDGNVMASNPLWCKSVEEWKRQLENWMDDESFEAIRHLLIFIDARVLVGRYKFIEDLKQGIHSKIEESPYLLKRMLKNTMRLQKGIGVFGQILVETHGTHTGEINLKQTALFPYVNAVRLLALKDSVMMTSTLARLGALSENSRSEWKQYEDKFRQLLQFRLRYGKQEDYEAVHYVTIDSLPKEKKKELKEIMKKGIEFYNDTTKHIEKGVTK